jgi:sec-independent protein translocase protein TatA
MSLGIWEIVLILLAVLILFGAGKLPTVMSQFGRGVRNFKKELLGLETKDEDQDSNNNKNNDKSHSDSFSNKNRKSRDVKNLQNYAKSSNRNQKTKFTSRHQKNSTNY